MFRKNFFPHPSLNEITIELGKERIEIVVRDSNDKDEAGWGK